MSGSISSTRSIGTSWGGCRSALVAICLAGLLLPGCGGDAGSESSATNPVPPDSGLDLSVAKSVGDLRGRIADEPEDGEAWRALGEVYFIHGLLGEAVEPAGRAVALLPDSARARFLLAAIHAGLGDPELATGFGLEALERSDGQPHLQWQVASWALDAGDYPQARTLAQRSLQNGPAAREPRWVLARLAIDEGRHDEAIALLEPMVATDTASRFLLGRALQAVGRERDGADQLLIAGDARPVFVSPWIAEMQSRRVDRNARLSRAASAAASGDFELARREAADARAIYGDEREVLFSPVVIAALANDHAEVLELTAAMLPRHEDWAPLWIRRGLAAVNSPVSEAGEEFVAMAMDSGRRAVSLAPADPQGHEIIGRAAARSGDWSMALEAFREACRLDAAEPRYRLAVGDCLVETGAAIEGVKWVNEMDRLYGRSVDTALVKVRALIDLDREAEARALFEQCRRAIAGHPEYARTEERFTGTVE